jgi:hypothetical protein
MLEVATRYRNCSKESIMKKVKAHSLLLMSCLALVASVLSARPAQADWRVSYDNGPATNYYSHPVGTPMSWVDQDQGLNGLDRVNHTLTRNESQITAYDYTVTATLHWEGPGAAPSTVDVSESVIANTSVGAGMEGPESYGNAIQLIVGLPAANLPTGVTPALNSDDAMHKLLRADFTRTHNVDANGNVILPPRRIISNIIINWAAEPPFSTFEYPSSFLTSGQYLVSVVSSS